jgi:hypothetical protein
MDEKDKKLSKVLLEDLSKRSSNEKDALLVEYFFLIKNYAEKTTSVLEGMITYLDTIDAKQKKILDKEIKEIEDTISLGIPGWVKYTRKTKKSKKT